MADGKQWYNSPQDSGSGKKPAGKPVSPAKKASGKPIAKQASKPQAGAAAPSGKKAIKPAGNNPVKTAGKRPMKPSQKHFTGSRYTVKKNPSSIIPKTEASETKQEKSIIPGKNNAVKPAANKAPRRKMTAKEQATAREQKKIMEQAKRKEEARLKEQAKIEKSEFKHKNPSQKSAESRAIRNGILGAIAVAAALLVLAFIVHHLYDYIAEKPNFSFVTIAASSSGELVTQITEGSRVAKGQELAIVVPEEMKSTVTDLRNVQSQISDVQQELILAGNVAEADVIYRNYNKNLSAILDSVRFDAMSGNLTNMSSYGSSVNVILDEREDEMSRIDFDDERIAVLRNDEKVYEAQVEKYASRINAHRPGIVSFRLDGKEDLLDYQMFLTLPVSEIKSYINSSVGAISSDLSVESDMPVCRIAQNESQYLTVYLSSNDAAASDFAVGTLHDINVRTEGVSIDNCKVVRCEKDNSGMLITFETSRYVEDLLDLRTVDIEIVITETDGMRVSVSSLVNADYAPKGNPCFCVFFAPDIVVSTDTFAEGAVFNINILPVAAAAGEGEDNAEPLPGTSVISCTVVHTEIVDGIGTIVAFSTPNDYSGLKKLDRVYTNGYKASFVDTSTALGMTCEKITVTDYSGMASVYQNNQGFVEEIRVILLDNDREFAIIDQVGRSTVPNLDTVIITNPKTVKPGDKVD